MNNKIAELLGQYFHEFYQLGLTTSSGGNLSCLQHDEALCISPSQIDKAYLKPKDFSFLDLKGNILSERKPSMEYPFHLSIYQNFPDVKAIMHLHPPAFVALSLMSKQQPELRATLENFEMGYADYAIPGSTDLGDAICQSLAKGPQNVLMQNHGMIAVGNDLEEIKNRILKLNDALTSQYNFSTRFPEFKLSGRFEEIYKNDCSFFEKRALHFLSSQTKIPIVYHQESGSYFAVAQLKSLQLLGSSNFSTYIIPESFLLLKKPLILKSNYDENQIKSYIKLLNEEIGSIIFNDNQVLLQAVSPYQLFDKLEVLDFTAKVILYAQKMGKLNLLKEEQIENIRRKFFK